MNPTTSTSPLGPPPETWAIIAAVVHLTFGAKARIAQLTTKKVVVPVTEFSTQHWSMEGRREIYSSHRLR